MAIPQILALEIAPLEPYPEHEYRGQYWKSLWDVADELIEIKMVCFT